MASSTQQYTLVGFAEGLDWKHLQFVKPLPENKLCSVCGLVRKTTALLSCGHVTCHPCFQQCWATGEHACPMDGKCCSEEDVEWRDFPAENLLKREVKCWNQERGCALLMAASELPKHFHRECEYHSTPCPRCSAMVLCRDMGEHLKTSCNPIGATQATEGVKTLNDTVEADILKGVTRVLQEAVEIKALLQQALRDNGALNESLVEACRGMNTLKESVKQETVPISKISEIAHCVLDGISTLQGTLKSKMADMKKRNAETFSRVQAAIESAKEDSGASAKTMMEMQKKTLAYAERNETRCDFFIPGIESLEAKAIIDGAAVYAHAPVYLRGYNISPGVEVKRKGKKMHLNVWLQLRRGDYDEVIQWPFEYKIRFTILHPVRNEIKAFVGKTRRSLQEYGKPTNLANFGAVFDSCFNFGDMKNGGYVCNDKLLVTFEVI